MKRRVFETSDKTTIVKSERKCRAAVGNSRLLASLVRSISVSLSDHGGIKVSRTRQQMIAEVNYDAETKLTKPAWYQATAKYAQSNPGRSLWQIIDTLVPYFGLWAAMVYTVQTKLPYWITLMLAVVAGGVLVRIFIFFHDCCHGSFFASRRANAILGYVTGILTFTPFEHWRHTHNRHHATTGDLDRRGVGDVRTMTTEEYLAAPLLRRFAYRCYRNPFILFGPGSAPPVFMFQSICSQGRGTDGAPERASHQHGTLVRRRIGDVGNRFSDISPDPVADHSDRREPRPLVVLYSASV